MFTTTAVRVAVAPTEPDRTFSWVCWDARYSGPEPEPLDAPVALQELWNWGRRAAVLALGDGSNDNAMLVWAGMGAVMANIEPRTKASANVMLELTNDQDGVAVCLERLRDEPESPSHLWRGPISQGRCRLALHLSTSSQDFAEPTKTRPRSVDRMILGTCAAALYTRLALFEPEFWNSNHSSDSVPASNGSRSVVSASFVAVPFISELL